MTGFLVAAAISATLLVLVVARRVGAPRPEQDEDRAEALATVG